MTTEKLSERLCVRLARGTARAGLRVSEEDEETIAEIEALEAQVAEAECNLQGAKNMGEDWRLHWIDAEARAEVAEAEVQSLKEQLHESNEDASELLTEINNQKSRLSEAEKWVKSQKQFLLNMMDEEAEGSQEWYELSELEKALGVAPQSCTKGEGVSVGRGLGFYAAYAEQGKMDEADLGVNRRE